MADQEVIHKLRMLSTREREVLNLFCEGNNHETIGEMLFIKENTVKTHMGHIYIKLGLDHLPSSARRMIIHQTYCPAIHEIDDIPQGEKPTESESEEPEPVPDEVMEMVEEDQKSIVLYSKPQIIEIKPDKQPKKKGNGWKWLLAIILVGLTIFGAMKVVEWGNGLLQSIQIQPAQATLNVEEIVRQTIEAQPVYQPTSIPTNIPAVSPTSTNPPPTPQPTRTSAPKISLPFIDDFSRGINSPWKVASGNWLVTNYGASISIGNINDDAGSISIDDPTLSDYKLRVKVHTPFMYSANQGHFGVIVRYDANKDQNIIFYMDSNGRFKWSYSSSLNNLPFYMPPITGVDKDLGKTDITLEITVTGNTFIARVDGTKVDQFSMNGYENGGVVLLTECGNVGSCPSFSNLSIEPVY